MLGPLAAALVLAVVATTLVAVVPTFAAAVRDAGVRAVLAEAEPARAGVQASFRVAEGEWSTVPGRTARLAPGVIPAPTDEVLFGRTDAYRLDGRDDLPERWITGLASVSDGLVRPTTEAVGAAEGTMAARLHVDAAEALAIDIGDRVRLERSGRLVELTVVELVEPIDPTDRRWHTEPFVRDGLVVDGTFTDVGPFLVSAADLAALPGSVTVTWRLFPVADMVSTGDLDALRRGATSLRGRIDDEFRPTGLSTDVGLVDTVVDLQTTATTSGAVVSSVLLQLVVIALAGVGLSASVLASRRAEELELLVSRGADTAQQTALAVAEGSAVAVVACGVGPFLAVPVVEMMERWGPIAASGLDLRPDARPIGWVLSAGIGALVVGLVAGPSLRTGRRRRPAALAARHGFGGLDLAVLALAGLALWRLSSSTFTSSDFSGRLGADPVLLLTPAVSVAAVTLLTLRSVRIIARLVERGATRSKALVGALASREVSRDPVAVARVVSLAVLATCIGVMSATQAASWKRSVSEQADAAVSADAFAVRADHPDAVMVAPFVPSAVERVPGVEAVFPVDRTTAVSTADRSTPVVLTDSRELERALRLGDRLLPEQDRQRLAGLHRPVDLGGVVLDDGSTVVVRPSLELRYRLDAQDVPVSGSVRIRVLLVDRDGTVILAEAERMTPGDAGVLVVPLVPGAFGPDEVGLRAPLHLVSVEAAFPAVQDRRSPSERDQERMQTATYELEIGPASFAGRSVPLVADWRLGQVTLGGAIEGPTTRLTPTSEGFRLTIDTGTTQNAAASAEVSIDTSAIGDGIGVGIPVLVTEQFLDRNAVAVGDRLSVRMDGVLTELVVAGSIPVVPFAVNDGEAIIADRSTALADRLDRSRRYRAPSGWAMTVAATAVDDVARTLADPAFGVERVEDRRAVARGIARDPVLIGLSAGWGLAVFVAPLIAAMGLVVVAIASVRERRAWSAVLRSLGVRRSELIRWRLAVVVPLVLACGLIGCVGGIAIADLTMASTVRAADGSAPVPAPVTVVPWVTILFSVGALTAVAGASSFVVGARFGRGRPGSALRGVVQ